MEVKTIYVNYDIKRMRPPNLIAFTHENDKNTQVIELHLTDGDEPMTLAADYTYTAAIVNSDTKALINDSIDCELNSDGNVLIPIDDLHVRGRQSLKIELTVTDEQGEQVLSLPFPIWVKVSGSILDDAQVTPESEGTVPELLEEAKEALENAGDYESLENKPQINGHELVGNKTGDSLGLQDKLTAGENVTIDANGRISATGGVTSYPQLSDLPRLIYNYGTSPFQQHQMYTIYAINIYDSGGLVVTDIGGTGNRPSISLAKNVFRSDYTKVVNNYNFNVVSIYGVNASFRAQLSTATNVPAEFSILTDVVYIAHYWNPATGGTGQLIRHVTGQDANGKIHYFVNIAEGTYNINSLTVTSSAWKELTSTISSATVNQNGTITFTMSDGSTVTTTGQSVIGPQGPAGADGNDYVLTAQDKSDIAAIVLSELPTTQGVQYGNSND